MLLHALTARAGTVRSVYTDEFTMAPISLRMGQSTVLRFPEKPKKVVLGNSNYYSVEFIDSDVALQPQGIVATNLFVYGPNHVYGFLLRTSNDGIYDDLIQVKWRDGLDHFPAQAKIKLSAIHEVSRPKIVMSIGPRLNATIARIQKYDLKQFYIVDVVIENLANSDVKLSDFDIKAARRGFSLKTQEFVVRDNVLKSGQSTVGRLLVSVPKKSDGFTLMTRLGETKAIQKILGKYL